MLTVVLTEQVRDLIYHFFSILPVAAVYHCEKIIRPVGLMTGAVITVADKIQLTDDGTEISDFIIGNIPYTHTVGPVTQGIVIGDRTDTPDDAPIQHHLNALHDELRIKSKLFSYFVIGAF